MRTSIAKNVSSVADSVVAVGASCLQLLVKGTVFNEYPNGPYFSGQSGVWGIDL